MLFGTPDDLFLSLVDHSAPPITIGNQYADKTLQLCAHGDPVCFPGGLDRSAHSSYKDNGMADQGAEFAVTALTSTTPRRRRSDGVHGSEGRNGLGHRRQRCSGYT